MEGVKRLVARNLKLTVEFFGHYVVEADQGAQYFTGEEAPATPAEDQATVYRYSYVRAADEILHEDP